MFSVPSHNIIWQERERILQKRVVCFYFPFLSYYMFVFFCYPLCIPTSVATLLYFLRAMAWWGGVSGAARIFSHFTFSKSLSHSHSILPVFTKQKNKKAVIPYSSLFILCFNVTTCLFPSFFNLNLHSSIFFSVSFSSNWVHNWEVFLSLQICSVKL